MAFNTQYINFDVEIWQRNCTQAFYFKLIPIIGEFFKPCCIYRFGEIYKICNTGLSHLVKDPEIL